MVNVDDGVDNTLDVNTVNSLLSAFKTVQDHAAAVVLSGRPGWYSKGLDMEILRAGGEAASELLHSGTELILRMVEFPRPLVAACTGHALGAAAVSLLSCDVRVGMAGDFNIGMDWVTLGVPVPDLAVELARARLSPRHMTQACNTARLYTPDEAVEAGFLDFVTDDDAVDQACRRGRRPRRAARSQSVRGHPHDHLSHPHRRHHAGCGRSVAGETVSPADLRITGTIGPPSRPRRL